MIVVLLKDEMKSRINREKRVEFNHPSRKFNDLLENSLIGISF